MFYHVRPGDTPARVARRFGTDVRSIIEASLGRLRPATVQGVLTVDARDWRPGTRLLIPNFATGSVGAETLPFSIPECYEDAHCGDGRTCDTSTFTCVSIPPPVVPQCYYDRDCLTGQICDESTFSCIVGERPPPVAPQCMSDEDCGGGYVCDMDYTCVPRGGATQEVVYDPNAADKDQADGTNTAKVVAVVAGIGVVGALLWWATS